jgi:hypothetical protein
MAENIPILNGKAAAYNTAILEVLYTKGPQASAWYLAKEVTQRLGGDPRNVYSVLVRKEGRIETLERLGYVWEDHDKKIWIDYKGILALLIHNPELWDKINPDMLSLLDRIGRETVERVPDTHLGAFGLKIEGLGTALKKSDFMSKFNSPAGYLKISNLVAELTKEGINLDIVKPPTLQWLVIMKLRDLEHFSNSLTLI